MSANQQVLGGLGTSSADIGDNIANSLMLDSASSQYLSRTFGTPTSANIWSMRICVKRGTLSMVTLYGVAIGSDDTNNCALRFVGDQLSLVGGTTQWRITTRVFRDPAAWLDILVVVDTTQATAGNRIKIYINGVEETAFGTSNNPTQNTAMGINTAGAQTIGKYNTTYFDGYLADFTFVDGQALTPSSFGRTSADTGQWVNKTYAGTYGNNGFKLDFANSADLGNDVSGNNNDWTTNGGISSANQYTDTPTNNYCVLNALVPSASLTIGNTKVAASTLGRGTIGIPSTMKAYWEVTSTGGTTTAGMLDNTNTATTTTTITTGVTKGFRFDAAAGTFDWTTDGSSWNSIATGLTAHQYVPYVSTAAATTAIINAGQKAWTIGGTTPPTGYSGPGTANLPTPAIIKPALHFNAKTRTGTGATYSVTGELFAPKLFVTKGRSGATDWAVYDNDRGVQKDIGFNLATDQTTQAQGITAFNSDGYTGGTLAKINTNAATYIDYFFNESATCGLDIVSVTGNGANRTVAHNLGVVPKMIIGKSLTTAGADTGWPVYHASLANTEYLMLNTTAAKSAGATYWNSTTPTSAVFSLGTAADVNTNADTYIYYVFAEVEGFSKIGSYTGNGSADGPFVYCGFKPRWVLWKRTDGVIAWGIYDALRNTYNPTNLALYPNLSAAEGVDQSFDLTVNGFKPRDTSSFVNAAAGIYAFLAIAEAPLKYATAR